MGTNYSHNKSTPHQNNNIKEGLSVHYLPQYGGKVYVHRKNMLVYQNFVISDQEYLDMQYLFGKRKKLNHPNLVTIKHLQQVNNQQTESICMHNLNRHLIATYDLYNYSLFNEIQRLCKIRKPMPESEVCRIFKSLVQCLEYLNKKGTCHGDIKVTNIFLDQQRNVKLIDSYFAKQGKTAYEVVLGDYNSMSLLAPQQLQLLRLKLFESLSNSTYNQIFSVGMCMIEITTIQQAMRCYDLQHLKIQQSFFINMMQQITQCGYSFQLSNLIMNCVHKNKYNRPTYQAFLKQINRILRIQTNK